MNSFLNKYFPVLPIVYLFVSIFLARSKVQYVYLAVAALLALAVYAGRNIKLKPDMFLARWLSVLASIGLSAGVILSIEKVEMLLQPDRIASCSISPVVACSPVIASPQASAFGFSNTFIGIFGFGVLLAAAMTILAGAVRLSKVWWQTLLGSITLGAGFCVWLIYQGVFNIGKLCLYCMLVWLVVFAMLWLVAAHCVANKYINLGPKLNKLLSYKYELITASYAIVFVLLFIRWSDYWLGLF